MKSWKTTLFGALGALGIYLKTQHDPSWLPVVGDAITAFSVFLMGAFARDNSVTSEAAGLK